MRKMGDDFLHAVVHVCSNRLVMHLDANARVIRAPRSTLCPCPQPVSADHGKGVLAMSHEVPITAVLYNTLFGQVVSADEVSTVTVWNVASGQKMFQFHNAHGDHKISGMCFDGSLRRLVTGGHDGVCAVWNFNNGQKLRVLRRSRSPAAEQGAPFLASTQHMKIP